MALSVDRGSLETIMAVRSEFQDTCQVTNIKTRKSVLGEILSFKPREFIVLTIGRSVKLRLTWEQGPGVYIGRKAGMEFQSDGPEERKYRVGR